VPGLPAGLRRLRPEIVAVFTEGDLERLMSNAAIVRSRAKLPATRTNARAISALRENGIRAIRMGTAGMLRLQVSLLRVTKYAARPDRGAVMPAISADTMVLPRVPAVDPTVADRPVLSVTTAPSGLEGEGFPVRRAFAGVDLATLDPFVHMDQMGEVDYAPGEPKGTPWHPHRGFETVTYMIDGIFQHQDSNGGGGLITDVDTQWMTAENRIANLLAADLDR